MSRPDAQSHCYLRRLGRGGCKRLCIHPGACATAAFWRRNAETWRDFNNPDRADPSHDR